MRTAPLWALLTTLVLPSEASAQERREAVLGRDTIAYLDVGSGPPVLLLHGFGETAATWAPLLESLASGYRVIVPDLPGHGYSSDLRGEFSFRSVSSDIAAFLDHLGIDGARGVGFSAGGIVLLHLATAQPDQLTSMVVAGAGPYIPEAAREMMRGMDVESMPMDGLQAGELAQPDTARTRDLVRRFVRLADTYDDPSFTAPQLAGIRIPTLLVAGDEDPFFPPGLVQEMRDAIPNSQLLVLPNHGHLPFPTDDPGRAYFVATLLGFLAEAQGSPN